jgi:hypothetical protein
VPDLLRSGAAIGLGIRAEASRNQATMTSRNASAGRLPCRRQAKAVTYKSQIRGMMNAFSEHREELERYEQMFGLERGRLAVSLDRLTNALVLVGQHGVYCTSNRNPMVPAMDLRIISTELTHAKELLQSVMEELRKKKEADGVK